jgi:hypothetical protein
MKCMGVQGPVHTVGNKETTKQDELCKYKDPHPKFGTRVVPVFTGM